MVTKLSSTMESNQNYLNLLEVLPQASKQDFHYGAKAKSYQEKFDAGQNAEAWLGSREYLGEFTHPFDEVLLHEGCAIEPDAFMKDLDNFYELDPKSVISSYPTPRSDENDHAINDSFDELKHAEMGIFSPIELCFKDSEPTFIQAETAENEVGNMIYPSPSSNGDDQVIDIDQFFEGLADEGMDIVSPPKDTIPADISYDSSQNEEMETRIEINESNIDPQPGSSHPPVIKINVKKVIVPKIRMIEEPKQEPAVATVHPNSQLTLKDALNTSSAELLINKLMEIQPAEIKKDIKDMDVSELSSYICSDSDESYIDSPSSSSYSYDCHSPSSSFDSYDDENVTIVTKDNLIQYSTVQQKRSNSTLKKPVKRSGRKSKLTDTEKKLKKMEQNKKAATRYRQKKKDEENAALEKLTAEEEKHMALTKQYKDMKYQIRMMKKLLREFFITKGLVSASAFQ